MNKTTRIRTGRQVIFNLHAHLVFVTKYRNNVFTKKMLDRMKIIFNSLKGVSSRYLRREFPRQIEKYYWKGVLWSPSYFAAGCGGASISILREH